jgi:alpha-glucosidase
MHASYQFCLARLAGAVLVLSPVTLSVFAQVAQRLDSGTRWDASDAAARAALPSMSFSDPAARDKGTPLGESAGPRPAFSKDDRGRHVAKLDVPAGTSLYGTGEVAGPLLRNGRVVETWNTDSYGYREQTPSLYQSHPWVLAVRPDGSAFGVLADTTWRCEIDLNNGITFAADGPEYPVIVYEGATPQDVIRKLASDIGTIALPPLWAIGYHQCRYSYYPESRVREVADGFRTRAMPCDVIWFDIDYMRGYRVFTFDSSHFPDPTALNADLQELGFHTIWMIDPGVKAEPGYSVFDSGSAGDHWVRKADGSVYNGEVWPGQCVFPDYTRPETMTWWAGLYKDFMATGIDGVWNDMNEPAIFNVPSKTMPEDNIHRGGGSLTEGPHARYHNVYGMLMTKGTLKGIKDANPDKRPFVLTRANYIGGHRYAATWTGDNAAEWYDLENSIPMILNLGLSGQPFAGPDIGGFIGNGNGQQFARWMGIGSLLPFSRGHTGKGNRDKEPWAYDAAVERTCRMALERRYRLIPYLYTLFEESSRTGLPIARPTFFADPADPALRSEDDSFLLGDSLLVVAKVTPLADRMPVMPRGAWRPINLHDGATDADLPDLYLREGAILPVGPIEQHVNERPLDPLTLYLSLDEKGNASGELYEDAGEGFGYQQGQYLRTRYQASREGDKVRVRLISSSGAMARPARNAVVKVVLDDGREATAIGRDGEEISVDLSTAKHPGH